jgi:hypothetical protein
MFTGLISLKNISIDEYENLSIDLDGIFDPSKILKLEIRRITIYYLDTNDELTRLFTNLRSLYLSDDRIKYE